APEDLRRPLPRVPGAADVETRNAPGAPFLRRPDELRIVLIDANTQRAVDRVARIGRVGLDEVLPVAREDVDGTRIGPSGIRVAADLLQRADDERVREPVDDVRVEQLGAHACEIAAGNAALVARYSDDLQQVRLDEPDAEARVVDERGPVLRREHAVVARREERELRQ